MRRTAFLAGSVIVAACTASALSAPVHLDAPASPAETSQQPAESSTRKLPPGVFLDEDGKPCKVCNSWKSYARRVGGRGGGKGEGAKRVGEAAGLSAALGAAAVSGQVQDVPNQDAHQASPNDKSVQVDPPAIASSGDPADDSRPSNCPPDVEELGRATWTFLHSTAAYYPVAPSSSRQAQMRALLEGLAAFYPCSVCAADFREDVRAHPPDVSGREALSRWLCERHNEVNDKLGKARFDCSRVDERWREGWADGRCD